MQTRPGRDRRPLLIAAVFALLFVSGLGAWQGVHAQLCPSILVASSNEKYELMKVLAKDYSSAHPASWSGCGPAVMVERVASGDAERLLASGWIGKGRPDVWSPAASTWVDLLRSHLDAFGRSGLLPEGQPPSIASSPLVVAMPDPMARAMNWPAVQPSWKELLQLANDPRGWGRFGKSDWGTFRLGKTDPGKSTSGLHSLIAAYYAATGKVSGLTEDDLKAPATLAFVSGVEASVSHYAPTVGSFLDNLAAADKVGYVSALSYISALAVEEQEVFHYNVGGHSDSQPIVSPLVPLAAIYPDGGTLVADHPYVLLRMSDAKRRIASDFLRWLQERDQQDRFSAAGFRDYRGTAGDRLAHDRGIIRSQPALKLQPPAPKIIAAIQSSWPNFRKSARILILLATNDKSQRTGVRAAVEQLSANDEVAIWPLEPGRNSPALGITPLALGRDAVRDAIDSAPVVSVRLPLYLNILEAYRFLKANSNPKRINAIVVITGILDDGSGPDLPDLEREVRTKSEGTPIRIYTVALSGSDAGALMGIEKASGGVATSSGDPADAIRASLANF